MVVLAVAACIYHLCACGHEDHLSYQKREKETTIQIPNHQNRNAGLQNHDVVVLDGDDHPWMAACHRHDRDRRGQNVPLWILAIAVIVGGEAAGI